jgi:dipeptidyl aminopeptidase/acylaminoacyl peptidase
LSLSTYYGFDILLMKIFFTISALLCIINDASAQKLLINSSVYGHNQWPGVRYASISDNGHYILYPIYNQPKGNNTLFIKSVCGNWEKQFTGTLSAAFAQNDQKVLFLKQKDSLCLLTLGDVTEEYIEHVSSFKLPLKGSKEWLAYELNTPQKELILRNLKTGQQRSFLDVTEYQFNANGTALLLQKQNIDCKQTLLWVNLSNGVIYTVWHGKNISWLVFSPDGNKLAFTADSNDTTNGKQIWHYEYGEASATSIDLLNSSNNALVTNSSTIVSFNSTGEKLFFKIQGAVVKARPNPNLASVDIYGYKDPKLQSQQLKELQQPVSYTYVFNLSDHKLIRLEKDNERILSKIDDQQKQDFVLVRKNYRGDIYDEWNWNTSALTSVYLVSTTDGERKRLCKNRSVLLTDTYQLSPREKYVIWYDIKLKTYFSFNWVTGITVNITKGIATDWRNYQENDAPVPFSGVVEGIAGWLPDDKAVLIYSQNDIFQVDPEAKHPPINLTNNYGFKHHIKFSLTQEVLGLGSVDNINPNHSILLHAFNRDTKDISFCKVILYRQNNPKLLKTLPYTTSSITANKAKDAEVYVVPLMAAEKYLNLYLTTDFKNFKPLSNLQPLEKYNWLTAELVNYKTLDRKTTQGILYKPENFDPKKKYPVIFHYYERKSDDLHEFLTPQYEDGGRIDIPTYVSNGYLVFCPDIYYKVGHPGRSAYNSIMAAANYLSKFSWVDKKHIGLMGHSFGGFETDYVITRSHLFAAAVSMSGMTDFVSAYGSIIGDGTSRQRQYELYRDRIGATLWQRPDLYIENSPVFKADKVTTPVLLMANHKDDDVPYEQGVEFFTALRRLGKKAWMLQYDNGGHQVGNPADQTDLTIRTRQFFDYYLKGGTPPKWMIQGVPANMKQIDSGLEADTTGKHP